MKKVLNILAAAAVVLSLAAPAFAQSFGLMNYNGPNQVSGRMQWFRASATGTNSAGDSTTISIPKLAASVDAQDTTRWVDLRPYKFGAPGFTAAALVQFQINHEIGAAADSIQYQVQFACDPNALPSTTLSTAGGFVSGTLTHVATVIGSSCVIIDGLVTTAGQPVPPFVRLVVRNSQTGSGSIKRFSVVPIIRAVKE